MEFIKGTIINPVLAFVNWWHTRADKMVLEAIVSTAAIRKNPIIMILYSVVLSSVGMWVAFYSFPDSSSILSIAFVTVGMVPLMRHLFIEEEAAEISRPGPAGRFLYRHFTLLKVYSYFFIGLVISFSFWYVVLPADSAACTATDSFICSLPTRDMIFSEQEKVWERISGLRAGQVSLGTPGNVTNAHPSASCLGENKELISCTWYILTHNAGVLIFAVIFSILYGAGAVFLLGWNASVIALVIGKEILSVNIIEGVMRAIGLLPHGIFEITGYFAGAIAGGILSVIIAKHQHTTKEVRIILKDAVVVFLIALILLIVGAFIESACIVGILCS